MPLAYEECGFKLKNCFLCKSKMRDLKKHIILFILSVLILLSHTYAQSAYSKFKIKSFKHKKFRSNIQIEPRLYYGFIINHHTELEPFNAHIPGIELTIIKDTYGRKYWERLHKYPYIGISFFYSTLADHPAIGQSFAAYPFIVFPIVRSKKDFLGFRLGLGLSYLTKTFDPITNYKNIAIGSHVNVAINLMVEYRRKLNESTELSTGVSLIHFSNGSTATPNYGLNLPMASIAISKRISKPNKKIVERKMAIPTFSYKANKIYIFNVMGGYASKNMGNVFGERYDVVMASVSGLKYFNEISALGLSFDFSWDGSHRALLERKGIIDPSFITVMRPGIAPTYEMRISHVLMGVNVGLYWGGKEKSDGDLYEQLMVKYLFYKNAYFSVTLRAHLARAAFVSWGIGYRLQYDFGKNDQI